MDSHSVRIIPVFGIPAVNAGDELASLILGAIAARRMELVEADILVVTQKIVSKAERRVRRLDGVRPGRRALELATKLHKDPRLVSLILRESKRVVRMGHGIIVTETKHGFVCANSGVDQSNVEGGYVTLLPLNPDSSARGIRAAVRRRTGKEIAVVVTDTFGRPWREGQVDVAIGASGIKPTKNLKGVVDPYGYTLQVTEPAIVDEVAAAAELVMGKLEMVPAAIVRGLKYEKSEDGIGRMLRKRELDLFR